MIKNIISVYDAGKAGINEQFRLAIGLSKKNSESTQRDWQIGETIGDREAILPLVDRSGSKYVVIFDDYKERSVKFSDIIYGLAIRGVKTIFVTGTDREPGNALLEAIVNVGEYDIIRSDEVTAELVANALDHPKTFADVSAFARKTLASDTKDEKVFESPDLKGLSFYSNKLKSDFLESNYDPNKLGNDNVTAKEDTLAGAFVKGKEYESIQKPVKQPEDDDSDLSDMVDDLDL